MLGVDLLWIEEIGRSRNVKQLPVTLPPDEVARIFQHMDSEFLLIAQLLYAIGLRILEAIRLRGLRRNVCDEIFKLYNWWAFQAINGSRSAPVLAFC